MTNIPDEWVQKAWKAVQARLYLDPDYTTLYEQTKVAVEEVVPLVTAYAANQIFDTIRRDVFDASAPPDNMLTNGTNGADAWLWARTEFDAIVARGWSP